MYHNMPANLPVEAKIKWSEASQTRNPKEKIKRFQEFLSLIPKHKGTENLRSQIKRKISILRKEIAEKKHKKTGSGGPKIYVEKQGDAQIVILGPTNVGRSSLLSILTNAKVEISDYLYTTKELIPGMFRYEDLQFQIVEAPAIIEGSAEGGSWGLKTLTSARNADGLLLMVDLSNNPIEQFSSISQELEKARILTRKPKGRVEIEKRHYGFGLKTILLGKLIDCTPQDLEHLLGSYGISNATVKILGEVTLDDIEDAIFEGTVYRPTILIGNKTDLPETEKEIENLKRYVGNALKTLAISCRKEYEINTLGHQIFDMLDIIRIYTKEPKKPISPKPFTLKKGSNISTLAKAIHTDFSKRFSHAKLWSKRLRFSPQKVGAMFQLEDGDTVELHMK